MTISAEATAARDAARNKGKFGEQVHSEPEPGLLRKPVMAGLQREEWMNSRHSDSLPVGRVERFDVNAVLDTMHVDVLRDLDTSDVDELYYTAVKLELVEEHTGPFSIYVDDEEIVEYIEAREAAGQLEAPATEPPLSPTEQRAKTRAAFLGARGQFPPHLLDGDEPKPDEVRKRAAEAASVLKRYCKTSEVPLSRDEAKALVAFERASETGTAYDAFRAVLFLSVALDGSR